MTTGPLLRGQADVSPQVPMPTDRVDDTSVSNTSSTETVVWYYVTGGAWAAAATQVAGTLVTAKLTYSGVLNSMGTALGSYNDTSLSFAATTRASQKVSVSENVFSQIAFMSPTDQKTTMAALLTTAGDYAIDHRRGQIWLNSKATVANDSATYQYSTTLSGGGTGDKVDVIKVGGAAVTAASAVSSDTNAAPTAGQVYAENMVYDQVADTWRREQGGVAHDTALGTITTIRPRLHGGRATDPSSMPSAVSSGDAVVAAYDLYGREIATLGTTIAGEDLTGDLLKVEQRYSYSLCTADTQVKSGAGFLHTVTFSCNDAAPTAGSVIIYDNTAESGTQIFNHTFTTTPFVPTTIRLDTTFGTGLYVGFTTTNDVNVTVSYR